ncbi:thymic stromal cotransporter homolog [Chiloscyllium plagiosum]|uniref:thymic stromal cotransporter homolog n=1 Tax=Chiloscyllium plagiosum TaxID=36176 RepID=UPI001CB7B485|nr:thymic stromal cotransporter homolog [Chiloscyllium plagiosum]
MGMCRKLFSLVEILVGLHQIAGAFYDTALLMLVQERSGPNSTTTGSRDQQQAAISQFYMVYNLLLSLSPLLFTFFLAKLGDQKSRKITIWVPLVGYLVSRSLLLFVILFDLPLQVMFATALLNGLSGGFTAFWPGVMALASDTSSPEKRSIRLSRVELTYGLAGMIGSIASGHLFIRLNMLHAQGAGLMACSCLFYALSLIYSIFGLKSTQMGAGSYGSPLDQEEQENNVQSPRNTAWNRCQDERSMLLPDQNNARIQGILGGNMSMDKVTLTLLFTAGVLYGLGVTGGVDVLSIFVLKDPLNWNAIWVGYGNAMGYAIFLTSFLGVCILSKYLKDTSLIVTGMLSFSIGILIMAFTKWTFLYFIARAVMMFALIPLPTIRSVISKQKDDNSYGKLFAILEILLTLSGVIASIIFLNVYKSTKDWYPSICFSLSSVISCLAIIPMIFVERRLSNFP